MAVLFRSGPRHQGTFEQAAPCSPLGMKQTTVPAIMTLAFLAAGCAGAPLDSAGSLISYDDLKPSNGMFAKSRLKVSKNDVLAARTVRIVPTSFSTSAEAVAFTQVQRQLITNAVDRTLCSGLSERFRIVGLSEPADLTIHATVTHVKTTNATAVGATKVVSVTKSVMLPGVPIPVPRIPVGLGSLSLEAEAIDGQGDQKAAMIWGRGANMLLDSGTVAPEGDAYSLAAKFGDDFSKLLVKGSTPFGGMPSLPSKAKLGALLGASSKYPACKVFGPSPGLKGMVAQSIGLPPRWTDKGSKVD